MAFICEEADLENDDVRDLLAAHFAAMRGHSPPEACHVLPPDAFRAPDLPLFAIRENGTLLGVGALKPLTPDHGEVKSMRTAPAALGRGVGSAMLAHLTAEARRRGYTRLSLETGSTADFAAALKLYQREGFRSCGPFGDYADSPFTRFFTLAL